MRAVAVSVACVLSAWARAACAGDGEQATQPAAAAQSADRDVQGAQTLPQTSAHAPADLGPPTKLPMKSAFARDRNVSVAERAHPEYAGLGVATGAWLVEPKVTVSAKYDDNIRGSPGGGAADLAAGVAAPQSDAVFLISPEIQAALNGGRFDLSGLASLTEIEFARFSRLDSTDFAVQGVAKYRVAALNDLTAAVQVGRYSFPFTNLIVPRDALSSEWYDLVGADVGGRQEVGRLRFSETLAATRYSYNNPATAPGGISSVSAPQSEQNHWTYQAEGRSELALTPTASVFLAVQWNQRDYDHPGQIGGNAEGYQITSGASFDLTHLMRGEVQVGLLDEHFHAVAGGKAAFARETHGPAFRGKIEWFPTQITTVTVSGAREFLDYTIVGAQATLRSRGEMCVDHEFLRYVIGGASVGYRSEKYIGAGRVDSAVVGNVHLKYAINRRLGFELSYDRVDQRSSAVTAGIRNNFTDNQVRAGVRFQY